MKIYIKNLKGLKIPAQAYDGDAAYDIVATTAPQIHGEFIERGIDNSRMYRYIRFIEYGTNIFITPEKDSYHTEILARSSISKYNLMLKNGVGLIDKKYTGELLLRFAYLFQPEDFVSIQEYSGIKTYGIVNKEKIYQDGDKIGQLILRKTNRIEFVPVDKLPESVRGEKGFGSSK